MYVARHRPKSKKKSEKICKSQQSIKFAKVRVQGNSENKAKI